MRRLVVPRALEYLEEALQEAEAAARWYRERSATAAAAFSDEIDAAESAILRLPDAWPAFDHGTRRYLLRRFPFSVVYRIEPLRIVIIAVAHARRLPGYWKSRQ
jgi:plasmid stabilization system protein ParE